MELKNNYCLLKIALYQSFLAVIVWEHFTVRKVVLPAK
jgi:hypothetical protein